METIIVVVIGFLIVAVIYKRFLAKDTEAEKEVKRQAGIIIQSDINIGAANKIEQNDKDFDKDKDNKINKLSELNKKQ